MDNVHFVNDLIAGGKGFLNALRHGKILKPQVRRGLPNLLHTLEALAGDVVDD